MFVISTLLGLWLSILYTATLVLAYDIINVTVTTTSTLVISVFDFAPTTHLSSTSLISTIAYSNTSIPVLTVTHTATTNACPSTEEYLTVDSSATSILTSTTTVIATGIVTYEKEGKEGDEHESHSHTAPPSQSETAKPAWIIPSTAALLYFDFLAVTLFVWCWVMGWFWWWKGGQDHDRGMGQGRGQAYRAGEARDSGTRALVNQNVEREMRRLGMV